MSKPPAPTCIAKALCGVYDLPFDPPPGEIGGEMAARYASVRALAQAVWDALLAYGSVIDENHEEYAPALCLPLVVPVGRDPQTPHA